MKNTKNLFKINGATYFLILTFFLTGLIKNILIIYGIILIHELGHVIAIKCFKYPIIKIEIYPMGGITTIDKKINTPIYKEIIIAIMGITFQILLFLIMNILFKHNLLKKEDLELFNTYNKTIMIFNLLPLIPLDGYQLLKSFLEIFFPFKLAFYLSFLISLISLIGFFSFQHFFSLNNYLIISFLIYKLYKEYKDFKFRHLKFLLERYLYHLPYHKIKYHNKNNLNVLKKETYHYFKTNNNILSERKILAKRFDKYS